MNKVNSTKKLWLCLSLLTIMAMALSACGPSAPAATDVPAATEPPAAEATVDPNLPPAEPTPVVNEFGTCDDPLILWHGLTGTDGAVFATLLEQFATENPDVCLKAEGLQWDIFFQKYPTATAAGSPPDMVIFHAAEVQQMASQGLMTSVEDIMYADGTIKKSDYNSSLIDQITVDGQTMAVPFDNHGWMLWYDKKILEDAGYPSDAESLPKNGAEFLEWAQKITTDVNGKHPTEEGFDKDNVQIWAHSFTWPNYTQPTTLWQFGGGVLADDNKTVILDSPELIAAIQYWKDLMYTYYVCPPAIPGQIWAGDLFKERPCRFHVGRHLDQGHDE